MLGLKTTETLLGIETSTPRLSSFTPISLKTTETLLGIETSFIKLKILDRNHGGRSQNY